MEEKKKIEKIETIIFTYNRAILLDAVLESIYKNFQNKPDTIHIIYQWSEKHQRSYDILKDKWKNNNINFIQRNENFNLTYKLKYLLRPLNWLWYLRWPVMIKDSGNFKYILENIISNSNNQYITFVPDDQIFYKETLIPYEALNLLKEKDRNFFRFFCSTCFEDEHFFNDKIKHKNYSCDEVDFLSWSLKDKNAAASWIYNFTIEATVYNKNTLLNFLQPMYYHNPITLEAIGLWEARFRNYFNFGMTTKRRSAAGYQANNVQQLVKNRCAFYDPDILMKAYIDGYVMNLNEKDFPEKDFQIIPQNLILKNSRSNQLISFSEYIKLKNL